MVDWTEFRTSAYIAETEGRLDSPKERQTSHGLNINQVFTSCLGDSVKAHHLRIFFWLGVFVVKWGRVGITR